MRTHKPGWHEENGAVVTLSTFCVPLVLATLAGCTKVEAARLMLPHASTTVGFVRTVRWKNFLAEKLGAAIVDTKRSEEECKRLYALAWARYERRYEKWRRGERLNPPSAPQGAACWRPTVAQFLRAHREGTYVLSVAAHSLLAREGKVVADTHYTKSKRARVRWAALVNERTARERVAAMLEEIRS